jgi:hypothetical protein
VFVLIAGAGNMLVDGFVQSTVSGFPRGWDLSTGCWCASDFLEAHSTELEEHHHKSLGASMRHVPSIHA